MTKTPPDSEKTEREKIWLALSNLFLDTDVSLHFDDIERTVLASSFSIDEIDRILRDEVTPVCAPNLFSIAGEWAGFSPEWLFPAIQSHLARPRLWRSWARRTHARRLRRLVPAWPALRARIIEKREPRGLR